MVFNNLVGMARRWGGGRGRKFVCVTGWRVRGGEKNPNESPFETGVELCGRFICVVKVWTLWGVFDGVLS